MDTDSTRSTGENTRKPNRALKILLAPLAALNRGLSALLKRALGSACTDVTEDEVLDMVDALAKDEDDSTIEEDSAQMITNIFEFGSLTAGDVMTHRTSIVGVDVNTITLDDLIHLALDMGFSRLPVYDGTIDKIVGMIIVKDLLCLIGKSDISDFSIREFLRDVPFVPEACPAKETFRSLTEMKSGLAVVVDEYGGTAGIVTLEDIIEEIMGNIEDEYDEEKSLVTKVSEDVYDVSGEADPDEVFELFGKKLPEEHEYETMAGFVTDKLGYIPEEEQMSAQELPSVEYEGLLFRVLAVEERMVTKIRVERAQESQESAEKGEKQ